MKTIYEWLDDYGVSHKNPVNKTIHWICVPTIMITLIGLFWSIPYPSVFDSLCVPMNWGVVFVLFAFVYYIILSPPLTFGMILVAVGMMRIVMLLDTLDFLPLWAICLILFVLAWIGQFIGHKIEGKKPSFFQDIQFLLIGPLWLLSFIYRGLGFRLSSKKES